MTLLTPKEKLNFLINVFLVIFLVAFIAAVSTNGFVWNIQISVRRILTPVSWMGLLIYLKYVISPEWREKIDGYFFYVLEKKRRLVTLTGVLGLIVILFGLMNGLFPNTQLWDLDSEKSLATVYSGFLLMMTGWIAAFIFYQEKKIPIRSSWLWIPFIFIFMYLALDEVTSIHENLGSGKQVEKIYGSQPIPKLEWLQLYIPFIVAAVGFFIYFAIRKFRRHTKASIVLALAISCYIIAIGCEAGMLLHNFRGTSIYHLEVVLEESAEMLGTLLFMLSFMLYAKRLERRKVWLDNMVKK